MCLELGGFPTCAKGMKKEYKYVRVLITKNQEMYMYDVGNVAIYINKWYDFANVNSLNEDIMTCVSWMC